MRSLTTSCLLVMPESEHLLGYIVANAPHARDMVPVAPTRDGEALVICGAGPSLAKHADALSAASEVWACNSALPYLIARGARVTHGFAIDQGEAMLDDWPDAYDVGYYLATSVSPRLREHLAGRPVRWFHNFLGLPGEMELYRNAALYSSGVQVGHGLNSVARALCLGLHMGFSRVYVYGADCACAPVGEPMPPPETAERWAWLEALPAYADGRSAMEAWGPFAAMCEGVIDGRRWHTRADMVISAQHLLELQRHASGRVTFVGDTLVNALADKDAEFMEGMPVLEGAGVINGFNVLSPSDRAA